MAKKTIESAKKEYKNAKEKYQKIFVKNKLQYKSIETDDDLNRNIKKFGQIIENFENGKIDEFSGILFKLGGTKYWAYISEKNIFIPTKFLCYKNSAEIPHMPELEKIQNAIVRKRLEKFPFKYKIINKNKDKNLYSKLEEFVGEYEQEPREGAEIYVQDSQGQNKQPPNTINQAQIDKQRKKVNANSRRNHFSEKPEKIVKRIMDVINRINEICKNCKPRKREIFKPRAFVLRGKIENLCKSENDFNNFVLNIYKIFRENTRYKNIERRPPYDYMLPDPFMKNCKTSGHIWCIINTLRNDIAHDEEDEITDVVDVADIYEEILGTRNRPDKVEDYQRMQIVVLMQFEKAMNSLLDMIKNDQNILKK